jgi:hypothetical protein
MKVKPGEVKDPSTFGRIGDETVLNHHTKIHNYAKSISSQRKGASDALKAQGKSGRKKLSCDLCGFRAARNCDLTSHMKCHSGEKNYSSSSPYSTRNNYLLFS